MIQRKIKLGSFSKPEEKLNSCSPKVQIPTAGDAVLLNVLAACGAEMIVNGLSCGCAAFLNNPHKHINNTSIVKRV
ncbi:hypothetical protein [Psychromonas aquimarina]|uniref:hypothetical protein n=1 Tax=Psychromonas aquimarina TaxID=444919 RepID=UPI0012FA8EF1|nr:hypothetical protein [Psychromonas aquimarina]